MTGAYIAAIDYVLPDRKVSNDELTGLHPQWNMNQVVLRSGVENRHWCDSTETALDLAEITCRKLFTRIDRERKNIGAILFCTQSPDHIMPPNACYLQHRLGLSRNIAALDYSLACSGFIYGLYLAKAIINSSMAENVLLVTSETYSKCIHPEDRGPLTLFGDGAAATLVSAGESAIGAFALGTDGAFASTFIIPAGGARLPRSDETAKPVMDQSGNIRTAEHLCMDGAAVLDFVKKEIPLFVRSFLDREGQTLDGIDLVIFHQASKTALDYLNRALHVPPNKQFSNISDIGNTVSASIPIALCDAEVQGRLKTGMRVLLVGFGVGLSWGCCIIDWR